MSAENLLNLILEFGPGLEGLIRSIIADFGGTAEVTDETIAAARAKLKDVPPLAE